MEDFLIREIDRLGEMLMLLAKKLGLFLEDIPHFSVDDVKEEFGDLGNGSLGIGGAVCFRVLQPASRIILPW